MISGYETTGDYDIIAVGKIADIDEMNDQIKTMLEDAEIRDSNTSVVLDAVKDGQQFESIPTTTSNYAIESNWTVIATYSVGCPIRNRSYFFALVLRG
jgi:hypothetical protein